MSDSAIALNLGWQLTEMGSRANRKRETRPRSVPTCRR